MPSAEPRFTKKRQLTTPSCRFPLRAGGTEPARGSPRGAGGTLRRGGSLTSADSKKLFRNHGRERGAERADLRHQLVERFGRERLRAVRERTVGVRMHLDDVSPSAPAAVAASASAGTYRACPIPWLGSTIIGRCEWYLITGTALMSSVYCAHRRGRWAQSRARRASPARCRA
jgi:hypothetical protein